MAGTSSTFERGQSSSSAAPDVGGSETPLRVVEEVIDRQVVGVKQETDWVSVWEQDEEFGSVYAEFVNLMEKMAGPSPVFDYAAYLAANPFEMKKRTEYRVASASSWSMVQIQSTATPKDLERWRLDFEIPTDVFLYAQREMSVPTSLPKVWLLSMSSSWRPGSAFRCTTRSPTC
ncbi:hypothetical protein OROGR_013052 [Orobanche gracilis]